MVGTPPGSPPPDDINADDASSGGCGVLPPQQQQVPQVAPAPGLSQDDGAVALRLLQSLNLTGVQLQPQQQQPVLNPFPLPDTEQLPLFSVNPAHGVLGVRAASVPAAALVSGPVLDLGVGAGGAVNMHKLNGVLTHISREQSLLTKACRESDINSTVVSFANPMSKRAVEFSLRMDDVVSAFTVDGAVIQADAANLPQVNSAIQLAMQSVQEMKDRCATNRRVSSLRFL